MIKIREIRIQATLMIRMILKNVLVLVVLTNQNQTLSPYQMKALKMKMLKAL